MNNDQQASFGTHVRSQGTERKILVTKAVSWLLRALVKHHRRRVETYLRENQNAFPKIALRETRTKLLTGRKTPKRIIKQK